MFDLNRQIKSGKSLTIVQINFMFQLMRDNVDVIVGSLETSYRFYEDGTAVERFCDRPRLLPSLREGWCKVRLASLAAFQGSLASPRLATPPATACHLAHSRTVLTLLAVSTHQLPAR